MNKTVYTITKENEALLKAWCDDWRVGKNVSTVKGARREVTIINNYRRLKTISFFAQRKYGIKDITLITEDQILAIFHEMQTGKIVKPNGKHYTTIANFQSRFKVFWRWWTKKNKKETGKEIPDISADILAERHRPDFVHLTKDEIEKMANQCRHEYKTLLWFYFDSGVRPQEGKFLKVGDIQIDGKHNCVWLNIREEIAKKGSFGRRIKLYISGELMTKWVDGKAKDELLFPMKPPATNKYIKRLSFALFKKKVHLYDLRHSSVIHYVNIIKKDALLKYRYGWKQSDKIEYYSRYIGLQDDVTEDDLLEQETRTKLEKEVGQLQRQVNLQKEQLSADNAEKNTLALQVAELEHQMLDVKKLLAMVARKEAVLGESVEGESVVWQKE